MRDKNIKIQDFTYHFPSIGAQIKLGAVIYGGKMFIRRTRGGLSKNPNDTFTKSAYQKYLKVGKIPKAILSENVVE